MSDNCCCRKAASPLTIGGWSLDIPEYCNCAFDVIDRFNQIEEEVLPNTVNHAEYQKRLALFDECYERMMPLFDRL